jgi:hypothetical protein
LLGVLWAAAGVSVAANVLSAEATVVGRGVAAWPPVALLLVVEVLARAPLPSGRARWLSIGGAGAVAAVAGVASFSHMHKVALAAGESALVAALFPLTVDGLAVVASVALVEVNHRAGRRASGSGSSVTVEAATGSVPTEGVGRVFVAPVGAVSSPVLNGAGFINHQAEKEE